LPERKAIDMTDEKLDPLVEQRIRSVGQDPEHWWDGHDEMCSFGGMFGCYYWIYPESCTMPHPMIHNHSKETPCPDA
jgi:hypothetical protein